MTIRNIWGGLFVVCVSVTSTLWAQPVPSVEQFDRTQREIQLQKPTPLNLNTNTVAPEMFPGENTDVGPQRILRLKPRRSYFEVIADSQFYYSDNVFLSDNNKVAATLFVNTIQAAFAPQAYKLGSGLFSPTIGFRSQWFNYDLADCAGLELSRLDFNAQTAFINGRYQLNTWQFNAGFDFTRLLDQDKYEEAYREYVPTLGFQKFFPVNDNLVFNAGIQAGYHFTETMPLIPFQGSDVNDRFAAMLNLSLSYQIIPRLVLQPFYRFQYTYYPHFNDNTRPSMKRVDFVHSLGASATYYFTRNISARIFANYEIKDSDYSSSFNYQKFDAGGGIGLDFRF